MRGLCIRRCPIAEVKELVDPEKGAILVCSRGGLLRSPEDDPEDDPNTLTGTSKTQTRCDVRLNEGLISTMTITRALHNARRSGCQWMLLCFSGFVVSLTSSLPMPCHGMICTGL